MGATTLTRRVVLRQTGAALGSSALTIGGLAKPFVRGAYAAGKLSCAFWDHWVLDGLAGGIGAASQHIAA